MNDDKYFKYINSKDGVNRLLWDAQTYLVDQWPRAVEPMPRDLHMQSIRDAVRILDACRTLVVYAQR